MKRDLPTTESILEELADKTVTQIERLAPGAFDSALNEMTTYHQFLLALHASRMPDGSAFSYAEVADDVWNAPHRDWIRQYRRLFERAANRLPDDDHFIRTLAYTPGTLIPGPNDPDLSATVVKAILDLGPLMMYQLEAWITKRTIVETPEGKAAAPRLALAGSDAKAYADVLPEVIGAWENILAYGPWISERQEPSEQNEIKRWSSFRASWPFLWQHLSNTAHCLAIAVWNEDKVGATWFREALVRWPQNLDHRFDGQADLRHPRLLFPDILSLDWTKARARALSIAHDYMPEPSPDQLFASVVRGAHDDVLLLTSALLLSWTIKEKQTSDIGARTAKALLHREAGDGRNREPRSHELAFHSLFLDLLRLEMAEGRFKDNSYAARLDRLVEQLDDMTERRVVPGRVFTPSTLNDRDDLLFSVVAILLAITPDEGDNGLGEHIIVLAREEEVLPEGDGSLRKIIHVLGRWRSVLERPWQQLTRGVALLLPDRDADHAASRLREIINSAEATIESKRLGRLKARPVGPERLEHIRSAIEAALLNEPPQVPFFNNVRVGSAAAEEDGELRDITFGPVTKAQLTEPPMESPDLNLEESLVSNAKKAAGGYAWAAFCGARARRKFSQRTRGGGGVLERSFSARRRSWPGSRASRLAIY